MYKYILNNYKITKNNRYQVILLKFKTSVLFDDFQQKIFPAGLTEY